MSSIHTLASYIPLWIQVTRLDRPIGWIVLLWPTWIALTVAGYAAAEFRLDIWVIFTLGVIITRSAGCVVNDLTDRKFDRHVKRTRTRPITSGNLSVKNGVVLSIVLFSVCLGPEAHRKEHDRKNYPVLYRQVTARDWSRSGSFDVPVELAVGQVVDDAPGAAGDNHAEREDHPDV